MPVTEIKQKISDCIKQFHHGDLKASAEALINALGYTSSKKADINLQSLKKRAGERNIDKLSYALWDEWKSAEFIFQITDEEINEQASLFNFKVLSEHLMQSYLFFAIELKGAAYNRGQLSGITRFMNRLYYMPVMVIFMYNHLITFAIINRRPNLRDNNKPVLEKITLIKDISIDSPHRAHIEILFDLSANELQRKYGYKDFDGLHKAWQKTLDTKELNKQFYQKLFNWYLWALRQSKFPQIRPTDEMIPDNIHQSESLIRLLTRLLFVWFMKEKGLINPDLFDQYKLKSILKNFKGENGDDTIYYKAILQNLFFATLNRKIEDRKPIVKGKYPNPEYGDPLVYRYEELFNNPKNLLSYFEKIPFLNGGLFDCLDQRKDTNNPFEIRLDGFSTKKEKQPIMPDKLFFGEYNNIDLSTDYDDKKKNRLTVFGLIDIFNQFKFTIEENTPVEEEVALDPELLGKVFENLLASYNPETQTTARKQTGSFYTPREIVNYMVDESLIAYLKNHVDDETGLRKLFSYEDRDGENPFNKGETDKLLTAIDDCKILDPACGSGAFPMGVLQKLIHILHKLDPDNKKWFEMVISNFPAYMQPEVRKKLAKENWNYVRKLGIIQQCLYGVDIQPIATQIAKLRFFISLLVDQREKPGEDNRGFEPLPNLDFKIVTANTLIPAPASDEETNGLFAGHTDKFFDEFDNLTGLYFSTSDPEDKKELKNQITRIIKKKCDQKIKEIESKFEHVDEKASKALKEKHRKFIDEKEREVELWESYPNLFKYESVGFFESRYFFSKAKEGFDIVIGNPPYIQLQKDGGKLANIYERYRYLTFERTGDIYMLFFECGMNHLENQGHLCYITSNKWMRSGYGKKLRKFFLTKNPKILIDLGPGVFESTTVDTNILLISEELNKNMLKASLITRKEEHNEINEIFDKKSILLDKLDENVWFIADSSHQRLKGKIQNVGKPLKLWDVNIFYGIKTGLNEAFIINKSIYDQIISEDPDSIEILKPILRGRDITRYSYNWAELWLIASGYDIDLPKYYPVIYKYLRPFEEKARKRDDQGLNWWNLRSCAYYDELEKEKIIWAGVGGDRFEMTISPPKIYIREPANFMTGKNLVYLLGVIQSLPVKFFYDKIKTEVGLGTRFYIRDFMEIPIPPIIESNHSIIKEIEYNVHKILKAKEINTKCNTSKLEKDIDHLVYKLFDFTSAEIKIIENN